MITLNHINYGYHNHTMHFSLCIARQERVAILGPSGAGKSTLLNLIAGFIYPDSGQIILNGKNAYNLAPSQRQISMLFQENNLFTHLTVYQNIALGVSSSLRLTASQQIELNKLAHQLKIDAFFDRYPHQLSGGQKQRVAIARCLLQKKPILLLDEPFSSIDSLLRQEMLNLVDEICQQYRLTLLMVTHNTDDASRIAPRSIIIKHGHIVFDGSTTALPEEN